MAVTIRIPTTLRPLTSGKPEVDVEADTVGEALAALDATHPGFTERITDETGALRRFVNVFVSDEDVRFLDGLDTAVPEGCTGAIVPAVAGGCPDLRSTAEVADDGRTGPAHVGKLPICWLD